MSETLTDPLLGRVIDGRYEVRDRVAAGGMATVYVAFDSRLERDVALKVMHPHLAADASEADFVAHFQREAKAAARLTHPGMVRVYDQGVDGDVSYLTMEYVNGENLRQRMNREATIPVGEALTITERVLDALASAHRHGLVHRDVKPENVLIDEEGHPKLTDFGLARAVTEVTSTASGTLLGTVAYLAPELITHGTTNARTDVYATGILLYELVTGRQPFSGETALAVASRHVHESVPPPSTVVPWLPPELDSLVSRLTSREPDHRPADAGEALALVRQTRAMVDEPTLDRRADPPSGAIPVSAAPASADSTATTVIHDEPSGSTVALPIGLGEPLTDVDVLDAEIIDDPEAIEPEKNSHRAAWWIAAIVTALAVLTGVGLWWYNSVGPGAYTTVPNVVGENAADAERVLTELQFSVDQEHAFDDAVAEGLIVSTDPGPQQRALNGAEITMVVSDGPRMVTVPEVVGSTEEEALAALGEAEVRVSDTIRPYSDTVPKGEVMAISEPAGEDIRHDSTVEITVSDGPEPIAIPDVVGMTEAQAREELEQYAITVTVTSERTEEAPEGQVFRQTPEAGADGFRTDEVAIVVSEGPPLVTLSDFTYNRVPQAQQVLEDAGLNVELEAANPWPWTTPEFVVDQRPDPGTQLEVGSTVTLIYDS